MEDLSGLDEPLTDAHPFEVDLNCLVLANLRFTLDGINRAEEEELTSLNESLKDDEWEVRSDAASHTSHFYDELRKTALCLAMVAVVTRLRHWIENFTKESKTSRSRVKTKSPRGVATKESSLISQLGHLNDSLGAGPVPIPFFQQLVHVRDSVIHHDSRTRWHDRGNEVVVDSPYCNRAFERLELTEDLLRDAVEKATNQVKWYDERLHRDANRRLH